MNNQFKGHLSRVFLLCGLCLLLSGAAHSQGKVVLDDFEAGVGKWTTNDKTKVGSNPATLVEVIPSTGTNLIAGSRAGGLFAFKAAQGSWASASLRVDGADWARIGARQLTFFLNAGGNARGVELIVRRVAKGGDEVFRLPWPVRLDVKKWRKVAIPLTDFKSDKDKAPLTTRLSGVYLLQFVMRGNWDARFLTIDQLQVEGTGEPIATKPPVATPTPPPASTSPVTTINVDYLRTIGRLRPTANVTVGASTKGNGENSFPLLQNSSFRSALRELKPRYIRLNAGELSQLTDSSRPAFDFSRLKSSVQQVRAIGAQPLVVIESPREWTLDARGYASFAAQAARAVNAKNFGPVTTFELATGAGDLSDNATVLYYNSARAALKRLNSKYRIGGVTCSSGQNGTLRAILKGAAGLDFLTVQDFGVMAAKPADAALIASANEVSRLRGVAKMLDASRWKNAALYSIANLNASRTADTLPADERVVQMISAAWWATYLSSASRVADQVFFNDGDTPEWGLLDEASTSRAFPAYYAMWLWNTFVPSGSTRVKTDVSNGDILGMASNTATAHNLLLINTTDEDKTAQIGIRGFPVLREARIRLYEDARSQPTLAALPKSPYQTIKLAPYAVAIVQFIEPPKK